MVATRDPLQRFEEKRGTGVVPLHRPDLPPCRPWTDGVDTDGYASFRVDGKRVRGHVWLMEQRLGRPLRPGHTWDHLCHDYRTCTEGKSCPHRRCTEETHLDEVPDPVNFRDRSGSPAAANARKTHCDFDHPLSGANVYHPPKRPDRRECQTCRDRRRDRSGPRRVRSRRAGPGQYVIGS